MPIEHVNKSQWQELASAFLDYNYRHLWDYGLAVAERRQATCEHVAIKANSETIGLADVRIKKIPMIGGGIAYISGGPLIRQGKPADIEHLSLVLRELILEYCRERDLVLRVQCPIGPEEWMLQTTRAFEAAGFTKTTRSAQYRTMVVDISQPLPEMRVRLAQKWRNCLNSGEKQGHQIVTGTDEATFAAFGRLFDDFLNRKGFKVELDHRFYQTLQARFSDRDRLNVSLINQNGRPIAGHVSSMLGDTCVYLLGATSEAGLKSKAAYVLQWNAIVSAKQAGMLRYDLGGIDPEENPAVHHFKSGMSGADVCSPGPFEISTRGWRTSIVLRAESAYTRMKKSRPAPSVEKQ